MSGFLNKFSEDEYATFKTKGNDENQKTIDSVIEDVSCEESKHTEAQDMYEDISFAVVEDATDSKNESNAIIEDVEIETLQEEAVAVNELRNMVPLTMVTSLNEMNAKGAQLQ